MLLSSRASGAKGLVRGLRGWSGAAGRATLVVCLFVTRLCETRVALDVARRPDPYPPPHTHTRCLQNLAGEDLDEACTLKP